jgi:DNA-binding XRE family transcriptional regulator
MNWLKELRKGKKVTVEKASFEAKLHKNTIVNIETGKSKPEWDTVTRLLASYGFDVLIVDRDTGDVLTSNGTSDISHELSFWGNKFSHSIKLSNIKAK